MTKNIEIAVKAALNGGQKIMEVYQTANFEVEAKSDNSPLTIADKKAHNAIIETLAETNIPVLSEEGKSIPFETRSKWEKFWMVDPLDGTKEFIKRNGEFTVNIALIENGFPIAGVIYVPVTQKLYFAELGEGSFMVESINAEMLENIEFSAEAKSLPIARADNKIKVVGSRSHMSPETEAYVEQLSKKYGEVEMVSMGSSLKICLVAEGAADFYPRFAPTMEWDTAAGQAIAEEAGMTVINWETKTRMQYNKQNLLNPWFLVSNEK